MRTRRDIVYEALRAQLESGRFRPGDRLGEVALAAEMSTSRGPLREALNQLASEGLVTKAPGIGAFVPVPARAEIVQVYEVRAAIESFTAVRAAEAMPAADVDRLHSILDEMEALIEETEAEQRWNPDDRIRLLDLDRGFHNVIVAAASNPRLRKLLEDQLLLARMLSYHDRPGSASTFATRREAYGEHRDIAAAIRSGDPAAASVAMRRHVSTASRNALAALDQLERAAT